MKRITRIRRMREELDKLILEEVEERARKILRENPGVEEFIMGMGTAFFAYKGETVYQGSTTCDDKKYMRPVIDLLEEFWELNIKDYPMRFTATGKTVTDW